MPRLSRVYVNSLSAYGGPTMPRSIKSILNEIRKDKEHPANLVMLVTFDWPSTPDDWIGHYGSIKATIVERVADDEVSSIRTHSRFGKDEQTRDILGRLELTGQFHTSGDNADPTNVYGWSAQIGEARLISLSDAEIMAEVLGGLGKAMDATAKKIGDAQTFGQWLAYAADAMGITDILTDATCYHPAKRADATEAYQGTRRFQNGCRYWRHAPADLSWTLGNRLRDYAEWLKARRQPSDVTA